MDNMIKDYVAEVMENIVADEGMKVRIKNDLFNHIKEAGQGQDIYRILERMGNPREMAKEFMDNIYEDKGQVIERLIEERARLICGFYEYKSKRTLFGLPLVHVKVRRALGMKPAVARGIIAIGGDAAFGAVAVGAYACGGICIGGASTGLLSLGGAAIGALAAFGGLSLGTLAVGGIAVGAGAIGGLAVGKIAFGGLAKGIIAIGGHPIGEHIIRTQPGNMSMPISMMKAEFTNMVKSVYPNLSGWIVNLFSKFLPWQ